MPIIINPRWHHIAIFFGIQHVARALRVWLNGLPQALDTALDLVECSPRAPVTMPHGLPKFIISDHAPDAASQAHKHIKFFRAEVNQKAIPPDAADMDIYRQAANDDEGG